MNFMKKLFMKYNENNEIEITWIYKNLNVIQNLNLKLDEINKFWI